MPKDVSMTMAKRSVAGGHPAAIVGAGAGGLCMAAKLKQAEIPFVVFEKGDRVGGTWRDNGYPGSGCDIVSQLYSFSFDLNPDWNRRFAKQDEIQAYMEDFVGKFGLAENLRLNVEVTGAEWDNDAGLWRIGTSTGEEVMAQSLITCTGQLNRPNTPDFPGLDSFGGAAFHSAEWDYDVDLRRKRVTVIGSGASAIQFVPEIAREAGHLTLFQRSPNWVTPKPDREISDPEKKLFRTFPFLMRAQRMWDYATLELTFRAFLKGSALGRTWQKQSQDAMEAAVSDPALRDALTPDYPAGCKRILLSNEWFPTMARDNVTLRTSGIERISDDGIVSDGEVIPADVLIFATGFKSQDMLAPMQVRGLGGQELHKAWADGAVAHRGITLADFPNLFMLYGPNTNLGHGSTIFMLECQAKYIVQAHRMMAERGGFIMPRREAQADFNTQLDRDLQKTVWVDGCSSWYKTADGRIVTNWSGSTLRYWWETRTVKQGEFHFKAPAMTVDAPRTRETAA